MELIKDAKAPSDKSDMRKTMMITGAACVALYLALSWAFDFIQAESRAGVRTLEATVHEVSQ